MFNSASERIRDIFQTEKVANSSKNDVPRLNIAENISTRIWKNRVLRPRLQPWNQCKTFGIREVLGHFLLRSTKLTISSQFYISTINVTIKENLFQLTPWLNCKIKNIKVNWCVLETCCSVLMQSGVKWKNCWHISLPLYQ